VAAASPAASSLTRHSAALRQTLPAVAVAAFAAFGGVLYGYDTGTISGLLQVRCRSHITSLCCRGRDVAPCGVATITVPQDRVSAH
jgi:hypothetical protein